MNAIAEVDVDNSLQQSLDRLKAAYVAEPYPSLDERKQRLIMLKQALIANKQALVEALSDDFGYRSEFDTAMTDVFCRRSRTSITPSSG